MLNIFAHFFKKSNSHSFANKLCLLHCLPQRHSTYAYDLHNTAGTLIEQLRIIFVLK